LQQRAALNVAASLAHIADAHRQQHQRRNINNKRDVAAMISSYLCHRHRLARIQRVTLKLIVSSALSRLTNNGNIASA